MCHMGSQADELVVTTVVCDTRGTYDMYPHDQSLAKAYATPMQIIKFRTCRGNVLPFKLSPHEITPGSLGWAVRVRLRFSVTPQCKNTTIWSGSWVVSEPGAGYSSMEALHTKQFESAYDFDFDISYASLLGVFGQNVRYLRGSNQPRDYNHSQCTCRLCSILAVEFDIRGDYSSHVSLSSSDSITSTGVTSQSSTEVGPTPGVYSILRSLNQRLQCLHYLPYHLPRTGIPLKSRDAVMLGQSLFDFQIVALVPRSELH